MQYMHIAFFPVFRLKNKKPKNQKKTIKPKKKQKKTTFDFEKIMVFSTLAGDRDENPVRCTILVLALSMAPAREQNDLHKFHFHCFLQWLL